MNAKSKMLVYLLIAVMLMLQVVPVAAQDDPPPLVEVTFSDDPSSEDENWPIIKKETRKRKDPSSGNDIIEIIVIRQEPPTKDKKACKDKYENKAAKSIAATATCIINRYSMVKQSQVSVGGGSVTGYVKNIADEYCSSTAGCGFYKMKRLEVWWTRTSTSFGVINARTTWGCSATCALCTDGTTTYIYRSGYFNPAWSGLRTSTYVYTLSSMPIMAAMPDYGGFPIGGNDSTVTAPRSQTQLSVYTTFYP